MLLLGGMTLVPHPTSLHFIRGSCHHPGIADVHSPCENQTQQGADEDEHLIEHGRVGPLDGTVEIILET